MARIGISITKSTPFRLGTQEFSNVYYYQNAGALPDNTAAEALIDEIVTAEKTFHSSVVTFVRGRLWSQVGTPSQNNMIAQKNLSGTGSTGVSTNMDKERAFLFRLSAGVDSRGNKVYLRKWYHACGAFASVQPGTTQLSNTAAFSTADRATMEAAMDTLRAIGGGVEEWKIVSKAGRPQDVGFSFQAHAFLEHHQLGDQWRAQ